MFLCSVKYGLGFQMFVTIVVGKKMLVRLDSTEIQQLKYLDEFHYKLYSCLDAVVFHMRVGFEDAWGTGKAALSGVGPEHFVNLSMYYFPIVVVRMLEVMMAHLIRRVSVSMKKHLL